jgi:hypothetical protein
MRGACIGVLGGLALLTGGRSGSSTAEDSRRSEILDRDPLFTAELDGVRWETSASPTGSGPGPGTHWTVASRRGIGRWRSATGGVRRRQGRPAVGVGDY